MHFIFLYSTNTNITYLFQQWSGFEFSELWSKIEWFDWEAEQSRWWKQKLAWKAVEDGKKHEHYEN